MTVWDSLVGQDAAVKTLQEAALAARASLTGDQVDSRAMTHAWLLTGPPGSGRSKAAQAFAAALQCEHPTFPGCGECDSCRKVMPPKTEERPESRPIHPDVTWVDTDAVIISIDKVRELVHKAQDNPTLGKWRVIVVEDADRMATRTTNTLLKAIEEPPERTVWILCTPSPGDVLVTIRSRCRNVNLQIPPAKLVAEYMVKQGWTDDPKLALRCALAAQSHIGRAHGLLAEDDEDTIAQRRDLIIKPVSARNAGEAAVAAQRLVQNAKEAFEAKQKDADAQEIAALKEQLGIKKGENVPPSVRTMIRAREEAQKKRLTRLERDNLDRVMLDIMSFYRDVLTIQHQANVPIINADLEALVKEVATRTSADKTLRCMDAIAVARKRLAGNVTPLLVLEGMIMEFLPVEFPQP
ncbi:hypothetical protein BK816_08135 [Boudabousia tangfeifanii]|uniref:DNA polymerase III subunit delta' n=1 Tax=Boudabousia tangfeifanii TaxID=1912795 RepID=A0A1D9MLT4_9ACTO|nr:DNA polymerase III subunit delta' [Boudabousia tangfeifanii]AOZ73256.1 hypothetical protein BK816_08135 [Boudabousia tangfeifanii]